MKSLSAKNVLIIFVIFTFLCPNNFPQETKFIKRIMTNDEFVKLKKLVGTYEGGKNYNKIIDGHGTGLMPPTEEQWKKMKNEPLIIDRLEFPNGVSEIPSNHDNSATIWFPPVGSQGSEGSCVSWACVYYTKTFQEAREHNWDLSGATWIQGHPSAGYQDKIFSPDFVYHQVNNGIDKGSTYYGNIDVLNRIGCCTWDNMPYNPADHTTWPNEDAWRQAPWYRSGTILVNANFSIENLKQILVNGNLPIININPDYYSNLSSVDLWTLDNYSGEGNNGHANTVVGYDDNYGPYTESGNSNTYGAFKVANSWGVGGWENVDDGFYYISYECLKQRVLFIYLYQDIIDYVPQMVAVFEMNQSRRGENLINIGKGTTTAPSAIKSFDNRLYSGSLPYPNNPMVIDITEFIPFMSGSNDQFFIQIYNEGTLGTIQYFSVEMYDAYSSGIPTKVYTSTETPLSTQQYINVYANIFTSSETIIIMYPAGGEEFEVGSNPIITYTSSGTSGYINLDYSTNAGTTWNAIANNIETSGSYSGWTVPNTPSANCKIRISDADGNPSVISKGLFRLGPCEFTEETSITLMGVSSGSAVWGDYDNDSDLDILLSGSNGDKPVSIIYSNNGNNTFKEETSISLTDVSGSAAAWGDYDNDSDLDILLCGIISNGADNISKIYRNNGNNTFIELTSISLTGVQNGTADWADYDNDGDLDILLTGSTETGPISRMYQNNDNNVFTEQTSISLTDVYGCSAAWGDYDNDGDLDILLTGWCESGNISKIYRNDGNNTFTEQTSISLTGVRNSSTAWGDYDNDGDLDIIITGIKYPGTVSKIYRNDGNNTFTEQTSIYLSGFYGGSSEWGDYDNDGDLDILLIGNTSPDGYLIKIYRNNGDNSFTEQFSASFDYGRSAVWGDFDNDGDLDILLTGGEKTKLYNNNCITPNSPSAPPSNLQAVVNGNDITFSWNKSLDNETPQNGLTYNLAIGTSPGACDILSPMADLNTGKRRIVSMGNAGHCNSWTIKGLPDGKYYWTVQAIDNCFAGSTFAETQSFTVGGSQTPNITLQPSDQTVTEGQTVTFKVEAECSGTLGFQWWNGLGGQWNNGDKSGRLTVVNTDSSSTLTITNTTAAEDDSNKFLCEVKNLNGYPANGYWVNTNTAALTICEEQFTEDTSIYLRGMWSGGSAVWGDYDNDNDLDLLLTGIDTVYHYSSKIYCNNGNNQFSEQTSILLEGGNSAVWGDYDNDGDLDILMLAMPGSKIFRNNGDNTFIEQTSINNIIGVYNSFADWGDYDNDGDLDILLAGMIDAPYSPTWTKPKVYKNNGDNTFTEQTIPFDTPGESVSWGDYDNDGDLDILSKTFNGFIEIYSNYGDNVFTKQMAIGLNGGYAVWGDYDNDGDLDIISNGYNTLKVYQNTGDSTFSDQITISPPFVSCRSVFLGDYDNDGDLDILLLGITSGWQNRAAIVYKNHGDNSFTELTSIILAGVDEGSAAWGDCDNDGDLDIILTGSESKIYWNNNSTTNTLPSVPSNLQAGINGNNATFTWDKSSDVETPQNGLTYNLAIGTTPGASDITSPMSDRNTGHRRVVRMGNTNHDTSWTIKGLAPGTYYWSVQAIDNCFAGSPFAPEQIVTIAIPVELSLFEAKVENKNVLLNWKTATEVNNYGFDIERTSFHKEGKQKSWKKIGFLNGAGTSVNENSYMFSDKNITVSGVYLYRLKQIDYDGTYEYSDELLVEINFIPDKLTLNQNYPNPFNPTTTIRYGLPTDAEVKMVLYDILGNKVKTIMDEKKEAGTYEVTFDGSSLANGIYIYMLQAGNNIQTKKMILLK